MILITSAAYVAAGLAAEFGNLPPSFLPLQNRRLYWHQLRLLEPLNEDIILSIPKDFEMDVYDSAYLSQHHVLVVRVPNELTLGASVAYVLNTLGRTDEPLRILHGDTLMEMLPGGLDIVSVSLAEDNYDWAPVESMGKGEVYAGYFAFSSQQDLLQCIREQADDFVAGVRAYAKQHRVEYVATTGWLDFGLANSYYRSKSKMTTQRVFNGLRIDRYAVTKFSNDAHKMMAEAGWIGRVPAGMKHYVPALWGKKCRAGYGEYTIEYFYLSSLSDIFVFGRNPFFVLRSIVDSCILFLNDEARYTPRHTEAIALQNAGLYRVKTMQRIGDYAQSAQLDLKHGWRINGREVPSIEEIVEETSRSLDGAAPRFVHLMHGDFCFSNILYDFRSQSIKVLDPRGRDQEGHITIYGDLRYDVAKLAHSVLGLYDFIISGRYRLEEADAYDLTLAFSVDDTFTQVQHYFRRQQIAGFSLEELSTYPILVHLFLSMIPLHHDCPERQRVMLANALRLYVEYKELQIT